MEDFEYNYEEMLIKHIIEILKVINNKNYSEYADKYYEDVSVKYSNTEEKTRLFVN